MINRLLYLISWLPVRCNNHHKHIPVSLTLTPLPYRMYIAHFTIFRKAIVVRIHRCGFHRFVCTLVIKAFHFFHDHIRQYGYGVITNHTPGFVAVEGPDRKHLLHTLFVMSQHRICNVRIHLLLNQVKPGMQSPVGIPKRETPYSS